MDEAEIERAAKGLTKARKNMVVNGSLGYGDDDHSMDGAGRRMLYALVDQGIFKSPDRLHGSIMERHTRTSYVLSPLGLAVRKYLEADNGK